MASVALPTGVRITYRQQYRRCGKAGCRRCAEGGRGHGPYWYACWWAEGRRHSRYLGTQPPPAVAGGESFLTLASAGAAAPELASVVGAIPHGTVDAPEAAPGAGPAMVPALRVRTLGGFAVWRGETPLPVARWSSRRATALFQCLLSAPGHRLHRERVMEWLWPEADPQAAATNLRTALYLLRAILDDPAGQVSYLCTQGPLLELRPGGAAEAPADWLDAAAFARSATAALTSDDPTACRAALTLYQGEYLPDTTYDSWAEPRRTTLRRQYLELLRRLAHLSGARGDLEESERCLRQILAAEPADEEAGATLMGLLAASGRRAEALRVYQALATALDEELGLAPETTVEALRARLLAQEDAPRPPAVPPLDLDAAAALAAPTNLPLALSSFVGRAWEVAAVTALLADHRLVTLIGPGGGGKTRLALEVAARLVDATSVTQDARKGAGTAQGASYAEGVWLVELAGLAAPTLVPQALAATLGVTEQPGQPLLQTLCAVLQSRHLLLVLDNCEHLLDACAALATKLMAACPHLHVLATSRQALGLPGEQRYLVPPLATPNPAQLPPLDQLAGYEAVQLFLERARARDPALRLTATNAEVIAVLCARLDGLPLAIELAAARSSLLSVTQIAARLVEGIGLLSGGARTALPRQQTLRATIDWSYSLLGEPERVLLRRLAVFAGGWTLEAAAAVCGEAARGSTGGGREASAVEIGVEIAIPAQRGAAAPAGAILDLLDALVDQSLVVVEQRETAEEGQEGGRRYRLLETLRHYSGERLAEAGERDALRERHLDWYLALAKEAETQLAGPDQRRWLACLENEHDNLRVALSWCSEKGAGELGLRLAGALWRFWRVRGYLSEGRAWLEGLLAPARDGAAMARQPTRHGGTMAQLLPTPRTRAKALYAAGVLAYGQGDYEHAATLSNRSLLLYREMGDAEGSADCLNNLGDVAFEQCDWPQATALYEESLALYRELGHKGGMAATLRNLSWVIRVRGNYGPVTRALYEESLALYREVGDKVGIALTLRDLGWVAQRQGDLVQADALFAESVALYREVGDKAGLARSLISLSWVALCAGDLDRATALCDESLTLHREMADKAGIARSLNGLGWIALVAGDLDHATALCMESLALYRALGDRRQATDPLECLGRVALARGQARQATALFTESLTLAWELDDKECIANSLRDLGSMATLGGESDPAHLGRAVRLFGTAAAIREALGTTLSPIERLGYERAVEATRTSLGAQAFAAAWAEGEAMSLAEAVAEAQAHTMRDPT